jgi:hypothetical protein
MIDARAAYLQWSGSLTWANGATATMAATKSPPAHHCPTRWVPNPIAAKLNGEPLY